MALTISTNSNFYRDYPKHFSPRNPKFELTSSQLFVQFHKHHDSFTSSAIIRRRQLLVVYGLGGDSGQRDSQDDELNSFGVEAALSMLRFYKREISPLLPSSCRYVPTCSEYSMIAYKKYGVVKGTVLTAWRLCRCNPLGGSGFDPPRWFDETTPPEQ